MNVVVPLFGMAGALAGIAVSEMSGAPKVWGVLAGFAGGTMTGLSLMAWLKRNNVRVASQFETAQRDVPALTVESARIRFKTLVDQGTFFEVRRNKSGAVTQLPQLAPHLTDFLREFAAVGVVGTEIELGLDFLSTRRPGQADIGKTEEFGRIVSGSNGEQVVEIDEDGTEIAKFPSVYHFLLSLTKS